MQSSIDLSQPDFKRFKIEDPSRFSPFLKTEKDQMNTATYSNGFQDAKRSTINYPPQHHQKIPI
jgi:hypothetical protein